MTSCSTLIWDSRITREDLLQKICLLAILGPIREEPRTYELVAHQKRRLTIHQEAEVAGNLAFLSRRNAESQNVAASGIEEGDNGQGMTVSVAVNGSMLPSVIEGLHCIFLRTVEYPGCSSFVGLCLQLAGVSAEEGVEMLLKEVVRLTFSRFKTRLRLGKRHNIEASPILQVERLSRGVNLQPNSGAKLRALVSLNRELKPLISCQPTQSMYQIAANIMTIAFQLTSTGLLDTVGSGVAAKCNLARNIAGVRKIGQYYRATRQLVLVATRHKGSIFFQVCPFQIKIPCSVLVESHPGCSAGTIQTAFAAVGKSTLLRRFHGSEKKLDAAIITRLNKTRPAIKVHAEIQLLCFYECHKVANPPRLIAASKASCYLCDLFLKVQGAFQGINTFGKLNERWILPDWFSDVDRQRLSQLRQAVERFNGVLNTKFREVINKRSKNLNPIERLIALSATWQDSAISVSAPQHHSSSEAVVDKGMAAVRGQTMHSFACNESRHQFKSHQPALGRLRSIVDLTGTKLPYACLISPDLRQLQITVDRLTLLIDLAGMSAGNLLIEQGDNVTPDATIVEAMTIPTISEVQIQTPIDCRETKIRIRHGRVFVNMQINWKQRKA